MSLPFSIWLNRRPDAENFRRTGLRTWLPVGINRRPGPGTPQWSCRCDSENVRFAWRLAYSMFHGSAFFLATYSFFRFLSSHLQQVAKLRNRSCAMVDHLLPVSFTCWPRALVPVGGLRRIRARAARRRCRFPAWALRVPFP